MTKVAIIIPARLGSTRLPRKALLDIHGKAMVIRVAERASKVSGVDRVIIATDAEEIKSLVIAEGFEALMTPSDLPSGTDRVAFVAKQISHDVIVNIQGDEPLISLEAISAAMQPVLSGRTAMGSVMTPFTSIEEYLKPNNVKVLVDKNQDAIYFSRHSIPYQVNAVGADVLLQDPCIGKHLGIYVYRRDFLLEHAARSPVFIERCESLEQLRALYYGVKIGMGSVKYDGVSVDTQEDLEKVRGKWLSKKSLSS